MLIAFNISRFLGAFALVFAFAGGVRAQVASDTTGVSVAIKAFLSWDIETMPEDFLELSIASLNGTKTTGAYMHEAETPQLLARMVVGKIYHVALTGGGVEGFVLEAVPPAGYIMEIEKVARERCDTGMVPSMSVRVRPSAGAAPSRGGVATSLAPGRTLWQLSLGDLSNGDSAGAIAFIEPGTATTMASLFTPGGLVYNPPSSDVLVILNPAGVPAPFVAGTIRQIIAPQVCVDVFMDSVNQCQMKVYHRAQLGAQSGGVYSFGGDPFAWYFFNPDGAVANAVVITCHLRNTTGADGNGLPVVLPGLQSVIRTKVTKLLRSGTAPDFTWTANDWYQEGEAALTDFARARSGANETLTISPHGGTSITRVVRTYGNQPWGEEVVTETAGTVDPVVTTFSYWDMTGNGGEQSAAHTRLKSRLSHGSWEGLEYYEGEEGGALSARIRRRHRPHKDSDVSVPSNLEGHTAGEVTSYSWGIDLFGRGTRPTLVETKIGGETTAKVATDYFLALAGFPSPHQGIALVTATRKDYTAAGAYLTTLTKYFAETTGTGVSPATDDFFRLRPHSVQQPDGLKRSFAYQRGSWNGSTFTLSGNSGLDLVANSYASRTSVITGSATTGSPYTAHEGYNIDDLFLVDGKSTLSVAIRDNYARVVRTEAYVRSAGAWHLVGAVNYRWNFSNQLLKRVANQDTAVDFASGDIYEATYDGERLTSETDESGIAMSYTYDTADRIETATKASATGVAALTTKYTYDAAGRVTGQRVGWGQSEQIVSSRAFDVAGRLDTVNAPGPNGPLLTSYTYAPASRQVTATQPLNRFRTEMFYADGSVKNVTGSAVVAQHFDYQVQSAGVRYSRVNFETSGGVRLGETWSDWLGRTTQTSRPGFMGQSAFVETLEFDSAGRPSRSTRTGYAPTLFTQPDALGQLTRSGLDVNTNNTLDLSGADRIADGDRYFEYLNSAWWLTSVSRVYATAGSGTATTVGTTRRRLTGFTGNIRSEIVTIDADNLSTSQTVSVDRDTKTTTVTTDAPGISNNSVATYRNGLAISSVGFDGITRSVGYDGLHRQGSSTDPRSGTSTVTYKPGSGFVWKTFDGAGNKTVEFAYDDAGRVIDVTNADGKVAHTDYNTRDQVLHQWGETVHPVEYGYNTLGERTMMKTYRGGSGWVGAGWPGSPGTADTTTWNYDPPSGLLESKVDAGGRSVSYLYNLRGQVFRRTWARNIANDAAKALLQTNYAYDSGTGELTGTTYNDTGEPVPTQPLAYTYTRTGQLDTVTDVTGIRTFVYNPTNPLQLDAVEMGAFYANRVLTRQYDTAKRANGFLLGTAVPGHPPSLSADLSQTYGYDPTKGRISSVTSVSSADTGGREFDYGYNTRGQLSSFTIPGSAFSVSRGYEPDRDLLTSVDSRWGSTSRTRYDYVYNALGQRYTAKQSGDVFADLGGSTYYRYIYNDRGEMTSAAGYLGAPPENVNVVPDASTQLPMRHFAYGFDHAGNRLSASRSGTAGKETYTLDATRGVLNQYSSRTNAYAYTAGTVASGGIAVHLADAEGAWPVGRLGRYWAAQIGRTATGPAVTPLTITATDPGAGSGGADIVRSESRTAFLPPATQAFTYDADGNLLSDGLWNYSYDAENRLVGMTSAVALPAAFPSRVLEFKYDYLGRRVQKRSVNTTAATDVYRRYLYDGGNLVAEFAATASACGSVQRSYTWGLDLVESLTGAGGVGALVQITDHTSPRSFFPTYDGNGNVTALLQSSDVGGVLAGTAVAKYEYSPAGELLRCEGSYAASNPFRFSTKFTDDETGLVYYGARYYSPSLGRFINRDPIGEAGGNNLYGFCGNDGVNRCDYLGYSDSSVVVEIRRDPPIVMDPVRADITNPPPPLDVPIGGAWSPISSYGAAGNVDVGGNRARRGPSTETRDLGDPNARSALGESWDYAYQNGLFGLGGVFRDWGSALNRSNPDSWGITVWGKSFLGNGLAIFGGLITPASYGEGARNFGTSLGNVYETTDGSISTTVAWGLTSWNVGLVVRGVAGQDALTLRTLDGFERASDISNGLVATASVALPAAQAGSRFASAAESGVVRGMTGRLGGEVVNEATLARVERILAKNNSKLVRNANEFLAERKMVAAFRGFKSGGSEVILRSNATRYELYHELKHFADFRRLGFNRFVALENLGAEESVFYYMARQKWLTPQEGAHAWEYINALRR